MLRFYLLIIFFLFFDLCHAQLNESFTPLAQYSSESKNLKKLLRILEQDEVRMLGKIKNRSLVEQLYSKRTTFLIKHVESKAFIQDKIMEDFVEGIMTRIVKANQLEEHIRITLILDSPDVNAFCYGRGIFVVTIGLLSRVRNEDELAFILSHELAHESFHHVQERIQLEAQIQLGKKTDAQIKKIITGEVTLEEIEEFRKLMYGVSEFSREKEIRSDSLGFRYFSNAGYHQRESVAALNMLDSAQHPKYHHEYFFQPLNFSRYPFQEYWLKNKLNVYTRKPSTSFMYSLDSLRSHPELSIRKDILNKYINSPEPVGGQQRMDHIISVAEFQSVESAYRDNQYDKGIYLILQLLPLYPDNRYLISRMTAMLTHLSQVKQEEMISAYAATFSSHYGTHLQKVNAFLYNLTSKEMLELAYHFINHHANFKEEDPSHYFLLWRICELSGRNSLRDKIATAFQDKFKTKISSFVYP